MSMDLCRYECKRGHWRFQVQTVTVRPAGQLICASLRRNGSVAGRAADDKSLVSKTG